MQLIEQNTPLIGLFILFSLITWIGSYLISRYIFVVSEKEQFILSIALSVVFSITLTNLFAYLFSISSAYLFTALVVLGLGIARVQNFPVCQWLSGTMKGLSSGLLFLGLILIFYLINRGLALFDENYNLPIIARLATGDFPPHFAFDQRQQLAYHYGLHLLSALFVQAANFSPWKAFDLVRALTHALMILLVGFWFYRQTKAFWASVLGAGFVYLAGSTQWLLLFLPLPWLERINHAITLTNTAVKSGSTLVEVLLSQWKIDGLGPISYPFAFVNALFKPQTLALTSSGASVGLTLSLLLLLDSAENKPLRNLLIGLVLASVALTAEYLFGMLALGSLVVLMLEVFRKRSLALIQKVAQIWLPALILAFTSGGVLTVLGQRQLANLMGRNMGELSGGLQFTFRWPPVLSTLYFGKLSFFQGETLFLISILVGPLIVLFPLSYLRLKSSDLSVNFLEQSVFYGAIFSFLISLFVGIKDSEGGITRLMDTALLALVILSIPTLYSLWLRGKRSIQSLLVVWAIVVCMSGLITFGINLVAIARPQTTYYLRGLDLIFYHRYWNRLEPNAQIFDPNPARAIVVFGRSSGITAADYGKWLPEWENMVLGPDPYKLVAAGYTHAYVGGAYWNQQEKSIKALWQHQCVKLIDEQTLGIDYRRLYDISSCR